MKPKKETIVDELCPYCDTEVELKLLYHAQECPNCKKLILPCSLCDLDIVDCNNCELEKNSKQNLE